MKIEEGKFPKIVVAEATKLRELATKEEKKNLNIVSFDGRNNFNCIYGQMTGYCHSTRAIELIKLSCSKVYPAIGCPSNSTKLNGSPKKLKRDDSEIQYWSPIEVFVDSTTTTNKMKAMLLSYIKGRTKSLPV